MGDILDFNKAPRQDEFLREEIDAKDVRERIHARARDFIEWLFSGRALISRNKATIGNTAGEPGASLSIELVGAKAGLWNDFATGEGGDLIELYRAFMGYAKGENFHLSLKEIASEFLGDPVKIERPRWQQTPTERIEEKKAKLGTKPRKDHLELGAPVETFKYYDLRGNIIASVARYEPDGTRENKTFRPYCFKTIEGVLRWVAAAPDLRPLFQLPELASAAKVIFTEGEGKARRLLELGVTSTSAMQGCKTPIEKTDWSPLAGKTIIIWPDNDEVGFDYAKRVAAHLLALGCQVKIVSVPEGKPPGWDAADCIKEGLDPNEFIEQATPFEARTEEDRKENTTEQPQQKAKPRIVILDIDDLESSAPPEWLVNSILPVGGLTVLWGKSGALKSFVAVDLALSIASGIPWHGHELKSGLVAYVAAEGGHGLKRRIIGWRRTRGKDIKKIKFKLVPQSLSLISSDLNHLCSAILSLEEKPVLIVVDTLARTFGGGDENKQADMNAYVGALDILRESTGANVLVIHHSGVHEDKRERGSNVLRGAADTVIKVSRRDDNVDVINKSPEGKQKDDEEFETVKLEARKVAYPQGDKEFTTLILNSRDSAEEDDKPDPLKVKLGIVERKIVEALRSTGTALGLMRITALTKCRKTSVARSLDSMVEKGILVMDERSNPKLWRLA